MENPNDDQILEEKIEEYADEPAEPKPFIVFHAFALEMWLWRIAVPVALVCSLLALLK